MNNNKHMTVDQRYEIFTMLENGYTVSKIALAISKDKSTISKEIKKHRIEHKTSDSLNKNSTRTHLCPHIHCDLKFCRSCNICQSVSLISNFIYARD